MNEFVIKNGFISQGTSYVSDGNLGVGVTSPTSRLEVKGIDSSSSNYGLKVQNSGGTDNLVVRNDGVINGNGFNGNSFELGVIGNFIQGGLTVGRIVRDTNTVFSIYGANYPQLKFDSLYTTKTTLTSGGGGQRLELADNVNTKFTWLSSTNIGINLPNTDSSIDATLKVVGSDSTSSNYGLKVQNSGGTDNLVVRNDGNVGIGTSTPSETLEVNGKTKTTNFQMASGATTDYILTSSDSQGNGKWTPSYNLSSKDYGSFYDTTTQTGGNGTIQSFQLNSSGATKGISITDLTGITVTHTGVYNIQFSAQIYDGGGTAHDVYIWLRKNGSDILNSNSRVEVGNNNNYIVAAWNFVEKFNSNDVINLMWYSESNTISILYDATPTAGPEIPSLILTITQI